MFDKNPVGWGGRDKVLTSRASTHPGDRNYEPVSDVTLSHDSNIKIAHAHKIDILKKIAATKQVRFLNTSARI